MITTRPIHDIYHDESKEEAFWHIFMFVPRESRAMVLDALTKTRKACGFSGSKLHFKRLSSNSSFACAKAWLSILVAALQQKQKDKMEPYYVGPNKYCSSEKRRTSEYAAFPIAPRFKLAIFHQKSHHSDMTGHHDRLSQIETTFRMGLQGAAHYLFSETDPIVIGNIFLDREEHYRVEHRRHFDKKKVLNKLNSRFRHYCSLAADCEISGETISLDDQTFLDLSDIFLGTFRYGVLNEPTLTCGADDVKARKRRLSNEINHLIKRITEGSARMRNSRFENCGTFSSAWIENDEWQFENLASLFLRHQSAKPIALFEQ